MKKTAAAILLIFLLAGCATYYRVRVNGYLDTSQPQNPFIRGASFCVLENKNALNPLLENEVKSKIEALLGSRGYRVSSYDTADFYISFSYSESAGRNVTEIAPMYHPPETAVVERRASGERRSTSFVTYPGYTTYVPYKVTVYTATLTLQVFDAVLQRTSKEEKKIWIGESVTTSQNPDLRAQINYLLVATFEHFGENTGKSLITNVAENDPQAKSLFR